MQELLLVALGGAVGASLRYGVSQAATALVGDAFPLGTLAVNLAGCFAIGFLWKGAEEIAASPGVEVFVLVGLLGAFTTFSTYGLDAVRLLEAGQIVRGALYLAASNLLGLSLVLLGLRSARWLLR